MEPNNQPQQSQDNTQGQAGVPPAPASQVSMPNQSNPKPKSKLLLAIVGGLVVVMLVALISLTMKGSGELNNLALRSNQDAQMLVPESWVEATSEGESDDELTYYSYDSSIDDNNRGAILAVTDFGISGVIEQLKSFFGDDEQEFADAYAAAAFSEVSGVAASDINVTAVEFGDERLIFDISYQGVITDTSIFGDSDEEIDADLQARLVIEDEGKMAMAMVLFDRKNSNYNADKVAEMAKSLEIL